MKCIKRSDSTIERVADDVAEDFVSTGQARFANRTDWKLANPGVHADNKARSSAQWGNSKRKSKIKIKIKNKNNQAATPEAGLVATPVDKRRLV